MMDRKKHARGVIAAACGAVCIVVTVGVAMFIWSLWGAGGESTLADRNPGATNEASAEASPSDSEGAGSPEDEQWPGQSENYVGPNGEGVIKREAYASDEEYMAALIAEGERQADVPREEVDTSGDGTHGYSKGVLIVHFYRSYGEARAREIVGSLGGVWVSDTFAWENTGVDGDTDVEVYFPEAPYEDRLRPIADKLNAMPEVSSAYLNGWFKSSADVEEAAIENTVAETSIVGYPVNDPNASLQYWLTSSTFRQAWEVTRCLGTVEVAVFDSGIDLDHEDLASNISTSYDAYNQGVLQGSEQDTSGHGTMVAGIVSAVANNLRGVVGGSYNAKIVPIRVNSYSIYTSWAAVERAFAFVFNLSNKPEAINMSFAGPAGSFNLDGQKDRIGDLVHEARTNYGIVCVAAAGNSGDGRPMYPAAFDEVVGVGATDAHGERASFSTYNDKVDICAPGVDIFSTANPDYKSGALYALESGTSFAAPQVAAAAAMVKMRNPGQSADYVEYRVLPTARQLSAMGSSYRTDEYGWGALDAAQAVSKVRVKTVAYLYAIDANGTAYFFTPGT